MCPARRTVTFGTVQPTTDAVEPDRRNDNRTAPLFAEGDGPPPVVLGWGLGVESSAILTRWLPEPGASVEH